MKPRRPTRTAPRKANIREAGNEKANANSRIMRKIIERFVEYPVYANLIIAVVILAGGFSLTPEEIILSGNREPVSVCFGILSGCFSRGNGGRCNHPDRRSGQGTDRDQGDHLHFG